MDNAMAKQEAQPLQKQLKGNYVEPEAKKL
jgi:hypothetical protein